MADEKEDPAGELSGEDKAYHESRGEKLPEKAEKSDEEKAPAEADTEADLGLPDDEVKPDKTVPLRALTKEREEGKKARAALQEAEKRAAILEDRWNTILALNEQQQQPAPRKPTLADLGPEPDRNVDIFRWAEWTAKSQAIMADTIDGLQKTVTERDRTEKQTKEEEQREKALWNYWHQDRATFKTQHSDFDDAATWMATERTRQLSALKGLHPQFQSVDGINAQIDTELKQIVIAAAQNGVSPAEYVYNMAREWGYKGPAPKPGTGGLEKLTRDMEAETSLSSAGGSRPGGTPDAKAIADMSPDDFERWYTKNGAAAFKRLQTRGTA